MAMKKRIEQDDNNDVFPDIEIFRGGQTVDAAKQSYGWDNPPPCGMIFEFNVMKDAENFAAAVKQKFGLDCRVFDDAEAAARSHMFPWVQEPPVVHVDRPWWKKEIETLEWDQAWAVEREIESLAKLFDGEFVGT